MITCVDATPLANMREKRKISWKNSEPPERAVDSFESAADSTPRTADPFGEAEPNNQ